jgi:hypothetical protein
MTVNNQGKLTAREVTKILILDILNNLIIQYLNHFSEFKLSFNVNYNLDIK